MENPLNKAIQFRQVVLTHFVNKIKENKSKSYVENNIKYPKINIYDDFIKTVENRTYQKEIRKFLINYQNEKALISIDDYSADKNWQEIFNSLDEQFRNKLRGLSKYFLDGKIHSGTRFSQYFRVVINSHNVKIRLTLNRWIIELWNSENILTAKSNIISFETNVANIAAKTKNLNSNNTESFNSLFVYLVG